MSGSLLSLLLDPLVCFCFVFLIISVTILNLGVFLIYYIITELNDLNMNLKSVIPSISHRCFARCS